MDQRSYHYGVMRRAIALIDAAEAPLSLEDLAAAMGMSPAHFQRVFSAWAGVSPQALPAAPPARPRQGAAARAAGGAGGRGGGGAVGAVAAPRPVPALGGDDAGRVRARGGEGLTIRAGTFDTPFGPVVAMGTEHGLCGLGFAAEQGEAAVRADLAGALAGGADRGGPRGAPALGRGGFRRGRGAAPPDRGAVPDQGLGGAAGDPRGAGDDLWGDRPGHRGPRRCGRWGRRWGATRWPGSSPATARCGERGGSAATTGGCR